MRGFKKALISIYFLFNIQNLYSEEVTDPSLVSVFVVFEDEADTYHLIKNEVVLVDGSNGKTLGNLKSRTFIELKLPPGQQKIHLSNVRYGFRPYTIEEYKVINWSGTLVPGKRKILKVERETPWLKPILFSLVEWENPPEGELIRLGIVKYQADPTKDRGPSVGFVAAHATYPVSSKLIEGAFEIGWQWFFNEKDFVKGVGLRGRGVFSPQTRGLWVGGLLDLEFNENDRIGFGAFKTIFQGNPSLESGVITIDLPVLPVFMIEKAFSLGIFGESLQFVTGLWLFPSWSSPSSTGVSAFFDALSFKQLWPSFRTEVGLRYRFF